MRYILPIIILIVVSVGAISLAVDTSICETTQYYSIGDFDARFNISQKDFLSVLNEAEAIWEKQVGYNLFEYTEDSEFMVNLIFDERQQSTINAISSKEDIDEKGLEYENVVDEYNNLNDIYILKRNNYSAEHKQYINDLDKYNDDVTNWNNNQKDKNEYVELQKRQEELNVTLKNLENKRLALNILVTQINLLSKKINGLANEINGDIGSFNNKFNSQEEFDQGDYTTNEINIYQFENVDDLRIVLAHELGHALGLDHVDDGMAIMNHLLDQQNISSLSLTKSDIESLNNICSK